MKRRTKVFLSVTLMLFIVFGILVLTLGLYISGNIDYSKDDALFEVTKKSNTVTYLAYDNNGNLVELYKESSGPAKSWVSINEVSPWLIKGFICAEDRRFYKHGGVNAVRTIAAAANSLLHYTSEFGASTITQQVIKNISGDNERTLRRKVNEIFRAIHLESNHTKDEILEAYLNIIPLAGNVYGVREASLRYFGKEPKHLTLAESATIVGITNAPSRYDPYKHPQECLEKRNRVLYAMLDNGGITEQECERAQKEKLGLTETDASISSVSSWCVETAREDVISALCAKYDVSRVGALMILNSGTSVILTVDPDVQRIMEEFFENKGNFPAAVDDGLKYAMVVCDSQSGDVRGIIGGAGEKSGNRLFNNATAKHPPASTLKPLALYAPLLDLGKVNWSTIFDDAPIKTDENDGDIYMYPKNSPDVYEGQITLYKALISSKNTVAAKLYLMLDPNEIYRTLGEGLGLRGIIEKKVGKNGSITTDLAMAPLALGQLTDGVSLLDLTHAYTVFPCDGVIKGGRTFYGVFDAEGGVILDNASEEKRVFGVTTARIMNMMLSGVADEGTARSLTLKEEVDTAAKTGTSSGNRDKLLVGYTPYYTAGIWCGYDDERGVYSQTPNHISIWDEVMKKIHSQTLPGELDTVRFDLGGVKLVHYCDVSGCAANDECAKNGTASWGFFSAENLPCGECEIHVHEAHEE